MELLYAPAIVFVFAVLMWRVVRVREQFFVSVRRGKLLVIRGRIPAALCSEFSEVLPASANGWISATTGTAGLVRTGGLEPEVAQRIRNLYGMCRKADLRSARPIARPNLGQRLGIGWLAWRLSPQRDAGKAPLKLL